MMNFVTKCKFNYTCTYFCANLFNYHRLIMFMINKMVLTVTKTDLHGPVSWVLGRSVWRWCPTRPVYRPFWWQGTQMVWQGSSSRPSSRTCIVWEKEQRFNHFPQIFKQNWLKFTFIKFYSQNRYLFSSFFLKYWCLPWPHDRGFPNVFWPNL